MESASWTALLNEKDFCSDLQTRLASSNTFLEQVKPQCSPEGKGSPRAAGVSCWSQQHVLHCLSLYSDGTLNRLYLQAGFVNQLRDQRAN